MGFPFHTNIADTVGRIRSKRRRLPRVQRGQLHGRYGDRTYAMLNVVCHAADSERTASELLVSYGNSIRQMEQLSLGDHTKRFAYYASINGNRSNYGLENSRFGKCS